MKSLIALIITTNIAAISAFAGPTQSTEIETYIPAASALECTLHATGTGISGNVVIPAKQDLQVNGSYIYLKVGNKVFEAIFYIFPAATGVHFKDLRSPLNMTTFSGPGLQSGPMTLTYPVSPYEFQKTTYDQVQLRCTLNH